MTEDASEKEGVPIEMDAGSCVVWHGRTAHYARGNLTPNLRRALITNFRPEAMVEWEREHGFDHLRGGFDEYDHTKGGDAYKDVEDAPQIRGR